MLSDNPKRITLSADYNPYDKARTDYRPSHIDGRSAVVQPARIMPTNAL